MTPTSNVSCRLWSFSVIALLATVSMLRAQEELRTWKSEGLKERVRRVTKYSMQWPDESDSSRWRGRTLDTRVDYDSLGRASGYAVSDQEEADRYDTYQYDSIGRLSVVTKHSARIRGDSIYLERPMDHDISDSPDSLSCSYHYILDSTGRPIERRYIADADSYPIRKTRFTYRDDGRLATDSTWAGIVGLSACSAYTYSAGRLRKREEYIVMLNNPPMLSVMDEYDSAGALYRHTWYGCCDSPWYYQTTFEKGREATTIEQIGSNRYEGRYEYQDDAYGNWVRRRYSHRKVGSQEWLLFTEERRVIEYW